MILHWDVVTVKLLQKFLPSYFQFLFLSLYRPVVKSEDDTSRSTGLNNYQ